MKKLLSALAIFLLLPFAISTQTQAQSATCGDFDVWIWAQTVFELDTDANADMDPDGNGLACEHLPFVGFSPLPAVSAKPKNIFPVSNLQIKDADSLTVRWNGDFKSILLHESEMPLTSTGVQACGAEQSLSFMKWVLSWVDSANIYVEPNYGTMADYDEHQAYVWMEIDGAWYMLNEVMIRSGWASYSDEGSHHLHQAALQSAESFAEAHMIGAHLTCGGMDQPANASASSDQLGTAATVQPDHGQLLDAENYYEIFLGQAGPHSEEAIAERNRAKTGNTTETQPLSNEYAESQPVTNAGMASTGNGIINQPNQAAAETVYEQPAEQVWEAPVYEAPAEEVWEAPAEPVYEEPANTGCHPSYGGCLPIVGDLNCGDIAAKDIPVFGPDSYGLDSDSDGVGCES